MTETPVQNRIRAKLEAGLGPETLEIVDESHRHAGHAEAGEARESHFRVRIVSASFAGQSRIARQREIRGRQTFALEQHPFRWQRPVDISGGDHRTDEIALAS